MDGFNGVLTTFWYLENLNSCMVLMGFWLTFGIWRTYIHLWFLWGSDYPLVSGGLKFIHGFNGVQMNLKKTEELIIASMQIKNSEMGDNPVGKFLVFYINTNIIKTAIKLILNFELMYWILWHCIYIMPVGQWNIKVLVVRKA